MRLHHLNCISTCPLGGMLMDGRTESLFARGELACHCLLVETSAGLVLVDTGLGLRDVADPKGRLSAFFLALLSPKLRADMTAIRQVERLGYAPRDVQHIVLTHLDFDHAGGLDDFPWATVHLMAEERDYAELQKTWLDRQRFRPQQWSTKDKWQTYSGALGEKWYGLERVRELRGLPPEIAMVPLAGHTHGHAGVAVQRGDGWLLQAGDAYFFHSEMDTEDPRCTPGLRLYQWMMEKDRESRLQNQARLRELKREPSRQVSICCGHDPTEFERLSGRPAGAPAERRIPWQADERALRGT
ncbi:MAG TPA: MBL fold metallo-hydrolase [Burkholderiales bacterium]|nr:MBL fold metallo-hydrolase [Burkholderiales bacterium]